VLIRTVFPINSMFITVLSGVDCLTLWSEFCIYILQPLWDACKSHGSYRIHGSCSHSHDALLGSVCFTLLQQIIYPWILIHSSIHLFIHFKKCTPELYIQGTPLCQEQYKIFPTCHTQNIFILFTNYIRWYQHLKLIWWMVISPSYDNKKNIFLWQNKKGNVQSP
jgi:hypothetical protein